ncbi:hypothetical protein KTO58_03905 [Chitinophaga pendula]|uniref:hypothetical protein n=1 Tax=Chitinophaga TaxID=79328 RepID=UPI000BAF668B|nr:MULTISPECIES: hypothetical protein [Chitinophaga]ASZ14030.1 hypothetical protein CK934_25295 [Chitinophaga sp. MD30]UCJ08341.1 hypothetical protein KTO58_03905 [Chitinophaga pendula]
MIFCCFIYELGDLEHGWWLSWEETKFYAVGKDTYVSLHYKDWPVISLDDIRIKMKLGPTHKQGSGR